MNDKPHLTATQANKHVQEIKSDIQGQLPEGAHLAVSADGTSKPVVHGVQCDLNSTDPNAPTQYSYYYEVKGAPNKQFPDISETISKHFIKKSDWKVDDKASSSDWDLRSSQNYLLSLVISPKGNLLSITLSTPCVPKSDHTFTP